jgi:tetratricopeptide (TPR) repeat protein
MFAAVRAAFRVSLLVLGVLVSLESLSGCGGADARRASHMARGEKYLAEDKLEKARIEFADALQIAPNDAEARFQSGRVAERLGNLRTAVSMYQAALEVNPEHVPAHVRLARLYVLSGAADQARQLIEPLLSRHPDDPDLLTVRAAARSQLKDDDGALADAERAVRLAPLNEDAVSLLAGLYRQRGQPQRAVELLTATLQGVPGSVDLRQALASLYLSRGDSKLAEEQLVRVVQTQPGRLPPRLQLASFYIGTQRLDDAEHTLGAAMAAIPGSDQARLAYAEFLTTYRSRAQGERALQQLIARDPHDYALQLGLGALQLRGGAARDAVATYRAIIVQDSDGPSGVTARDRIAAIEATSGDYNDALTLIAAALKRNPRDSDALTLRGNIRLEQGDAVGAVADLRAVLREQPTAVPILRSLARAHLANGEAALAEQNLRTAIAAAPGEISARVDLAQLLSRTRRVEEAVTLLEDAVRAAPAASGTAARTALVLAYLGKPDLAAARSAAEDLKTLHPELAIGPYLAGLVAQQQKRPDDAQREFEHALQLQPHETDALTALARLEFARGQHAQAVALVRGAAQQAPGSAAMHNLLGELYLADKRYPEAVASFAEAMRLAPTWWLPYRNLALAKFGSQDSAAALAAYQAGVKATGEPALVSDLAAIYERQGRIDDAIRQYEVLYELRPHLQIAANNLAMLLVTYRKDQASLDRARDLTAPFANTDVAALLDTHGWVMFKRGEVLRALSALEKAAAHAPDSQVIRYHLGMTELQAGQLERARADLESALSGSDNFAGSEEARQTLASLKQRSAG